MSDKSIKIPQIRFKGFNDEWKQCKLGSIVRLNGRIGFRGYTEKDIISKDEGGVLTFSPTNIIDNCLSINCKNTYITQFKFDESPEIKVKNGDILFVKTGSTLGKSALVTGLSEDATLNPQIVVMRTEKGIEKFISVMLTNDIVLKQVATAKIGGAIPTLTETKIKEFNIVMPNQIAEKIAIGDLFTSIDNLITLHQRKLELLQQTKKGMLQKMFPKEGANVPEVRFARFTDAWKQHKLRDVANKVTEKNTKLEFSETLTNSAEFGIVSQSDFFDRDIANAENIGGYYVVRNDDFVYNPRISKFAPVGPINRNKLGRDGVMSPLYTVLRTHNINKTYVEQYFKSNYWHLFMKCNGDTGARSDRFAIKDSVLMEMPVPYPAIEEQEKIGKYLTYLDNLITLQQRELELLKKLKKSMLQKMFI